MFSVQWVPEIWLKWKKKLRKKCFGSRFYLSPTWTIYNPTNDGTHQHRRGLHHGRWLIKFAVPHQPQPTTFMRDSKYLRKWPCKIPTDRDVLGLLSGVPDYFDRNKILSGYDLSHYQVPHCIESFLLFCLICVYSWQFSILFWIMYLL